jgi:hypothetical protein
LVLVVGIFATIDMFVYFGFFRDMFCRNVFHVRTCLKGIIKS